MKLFSDGTISKNDCNNEFNVGTIQYLICRFNKINTTKNKILLLELREKFYSWEQSIIFKEIRSQI